MIKIKELRQKAGITQVELSKRLNVCQSAIAMWESGVNAPRADKLPEIAKILKCDVADLFESEV